MAAADKVIVGLKLQRVGTLDTPGKVGKMVTLAGDGHVYHDNGVDWDDLTDPSDTSLELRIGALERSKGIKALLAPRRAAFRAMVGKRRFLSNGGSNGF